MCVYRRHPLKWTYTKLVIWFHLLLYSPTSVFATQPNSWKDIRIVDDFSLDTSNLHSKHVKDLFHPTSFLNPGYGVLFEHIGQLHQSVHRHYLVLGFTIPTFTNVPKQPAHWHTLCLNYTATATEQTFETLNKTFLHDPCAMQEFTKLYRELAILLHSDLPALLPNQVVPFEDTTIFNTTKDDFPEHPMNTLYDHVPPPKRTGHYSIESLPKGYRDIIE